MTSPSTSDPVIALRSAGKRYILKKQRPFLVWDVVHRIAKAGRGKEYFWALQDVTLDIRSGESVALVGRNGAGKSTLLGLIAGAISPTSGTVERRGRLGALLELGAGFHPDLTGRENIYLNASLQGLGKADIESQFQSIVDFGELEEFIDVPLRTYSSGMYVRLGFSVAIHVHPDIIIMDEALAVGDEAFQEKCRDRIIQMKREGKTLLFVSHSASLVTQFCDRCVWLDHGRLRADGPAAEIVAAYQQHVHQPRA